MARVHPETGGQPAVTTRLEGAVRRGRPVTILVDGEPVGAFEGESLAAALLAADRRVLRRTPRTGEPRGVFCGMGVCFDCVVTVRESSVVRSCMALVEDGLVVTTGRS